MSDLTIKEIQGKRAKLEADIYLSVSKLIDSFQHENDIAVRSVDINLIETQQMQDKRPTYILTGVGVDIDI